MVIHRNLFFLLIFLVYIIAVAGNKLVWLLGTDTATGIFAFQGRGNALDQFPESASFIRFQYRNETIWFKARGWLGLPENAPVAVRFKKNNPQDARIDNFKGIWLSTVIYGSMPLLLLLVIFVHPQVVPWRSRIVLIRSKPFIKLIS